jgi:hypothetical protein
VSDSQRFAFHGLGTALSNPLLATLFCGFAYAHLQRFLAQPRPGMGQSRGTASLCCVGERGSPTPLFM